MRFFPTIPHGPGEPIPDIPKFPIRLAVNFVDFGDCESFRSPFECLPNLERRLRYTKKYVGCVHCHGEQGAAERAMGEKPASFQYN